MTQFAMSLRLIVLLTAFISIVPPIVLHAGNKEMPTGNVIFIHPDGSGGSMWAALRMHRYGPDSSSNWVTISAIASRANG